MTGTIKFSLVKTLKFAYLYRLFSGLSAPQKLQQSVWKHWHVDSLNTSKVMFVVMRVTVTDDKPTVTGWLAPPPTMVQLGDVDGSCITIEHWNSIWFGAGSSKTKKLTV